MQSCSLPAMATRIGSAMMGLECGDGEDEHLQNTLPAEQLACHCPDVGKREPRFFRNEESVDLLADQPLRAEDPFLPEMSISSAIGSPVPHPRPEEISHALARFAGEGTGLHIEGTERFLF